MTVFRSKKIDPRAFQRLEIDVVDVVNQHKNAREAERKAEAEKHYREQQRIENERRAALKQKEENHRAWLFNRILERKEGGFSHDLIALSINLKIHLKKMQLLNFWILENLKNQFLKINILSTAYRKFALAI